MCGVQLLVPFPNLNGACKWIEQFTPHFIMDVITFHAGIKINPRKYKGQHKKDTHIQRMQGSTPKISHKTWISLRNLVCVFAAYFWRYMQPSKYNHLKCFYCIISNTKLCRND